MGVKSANGFFTFLGGRDVSTPAPQDVTIILQAVQEGDESASERLLPLVYDELRKLARRRMANEPSDHTLQATALVHEAYLRLVGAAYPPCAWTMYWTPCWKRCPRTQPSFARSCTATSM